MPQRTESPRRSSVRRLRALVAGSTLVLAATLLPGGTAAADPDGDGTPSAPFTVAPGLAVPEAQREAEALEVLEEAQEALDPDPGEDVKDATIALRDLRFALDDLPAAERTEGEALLNAPTDSAPCADLTDGFFLVHCDAAPEGYTPADLLAALQAARARFQQLGYRMPPADRDGRYDVHISDLQDGLFGYAAPQSNRRVTSSYLVVSNDLSWWTRRPPVDTMRVTAVHEFFHAVQFGYDAAEDGWLMEATATWAEDEVAATDSIDDNRSYLRWSPITRPTRPMTKFEGQFPYGSWVFFRYLSERFGAGIVRAIWSRSEGDPYSLPAIDGALRARNTNLGRVFAEFSDANRRPARAYAEGAGYPVKPLADQRTFSRIGAAQTFRTPGLGQLSSVTYRFDSRRLRRVAGLRVAIDMPATVTGSQAVVTTYHTSGAVRSRVVWLGSAGNRTLRVPFGSADVRAVEVTVANASRRMVDCWTDFGAVWPCLGFPRDGGKVSTVRAVVVRR